MSDYVLNPRVSTPVAYQGVTVTSSYAPEGEAAFASMDDAFEAASPHLAALIIGAGELEVGEDSEAA